MRGPAATVVAVLSVGAALLLTAPLASAAPPVPTIGSGPTGTINNTTPTFTFSSAGATAFTCSIAGPTTIAATACDSGSFTSPALTDGAYTFTVTADDGTGASDAATRPFAVFTLAAPTIGSGPTGTINNTTPTFTFSSAGATAFTCSIAGPTTIAATACNSGSFTSPALTDGAYTFTVTASDTGGTSAATTRTFTVDTPPAAPTIGSGPTGTINNTTPTFTFSSAGATAFTCSIAGPTTIAATACNSGSFTSPALTDGAYTFTVTASDAGGTSAATTRTFTVKTTAPPAPTITGPSGTINDSTPTFGFTSAGATSLKCSVDTPTTPTAACSSPFTPAATLADGAHVFYVTASDALGNTSTAASQTFTVDTKPPVLTGPGNLTVEADGSGGTRVTFTVSASDGTPPLALLPGAIICNPASPAQFPLGTQTVTCTGTDDAGNVGELSFTVTVRDTTPPAINAPDASFTATSASGISRSDPTIASYLSRISATDLVSATTLTTTIPDVLPIGETKILVTARDGAGNESQRTVTLTVLAPGKPAPAPDFTPPGKVRGVAARAGDHTVLLTWALPADKDIAFARIERSVVGKPGSTVAYRGLGKVFTSKGLSNGVAYRFTLVVVDRAGNSSLPVVVSATPKALLLALPRPGAAVLKPPLLRWAPVSSGSYFNVQLYRDGVKILSAWPAVAHLQLTSHWKYDGRTYTLQPGLYTWYVWPGVGARADAVYGDLLGKSGFSVVVSKKV